MSQIHVEVSEIIDAPADVVYAILSDYHQGHRAILPEPYFTALVVERGGQGAGTVIRVHMKVLGVERVFHMEVTEPEPGRVLVETDTAAGVVTRFVVEPIPGDRQSRVTIATDAKASAGLTGLMERLINPPVTRHIYQQELRNLDRYARQVGAPGASREAN